MTELEKHLLEALEQAQAQQQQREADLLKMFEYQAGQFQREKSLQRFLRQYEGSRPNQKQQLEQISTAGEQLERSTRGLSSAKYELEQAITSARNASQQVKEINEPARSYGISM